jgi:hypothetical protein
MGLDSNQLRQDMCTMNPDDPKNYEKWGQLVKTWVTGNNQFNDGNDYSIPATKDSLQPLGSMTKEKFQSMLSNAGVVMTIPERIKTFVFVQDDDSTVIVRVPAKRVVEHIQGQLEGLISAGGAAKYPLPSFYADNWPPNEQKSVDENKLLTMHCQRIGEYTINTCG